MKTWSEEDTWKLITLVTETNKSWYHIANKLKRTINACQQRFYTIKRTCILLDNNHADTIEVDMEIDIDIETPSCQLLPPLPHRLLLPEPTSKPTHTLYTKTRGLQRKSTPRKTFMKNYKGKKSGRMKHIQINTLASVYLMFMDQKSIEPFAETFDVTLNTLFCWMNTINRAMSGRKIQQNATTVAKVVNFLINNQIKNS